MTNRGGRPGNSKPIAILVLVAVIAIAGVIYVQGPRQDTGISRTASTPPGTSSVSVATMVNLGSGYTIKIQLLNSTLSMPSSGRAYADFNVSSGANATLYFEVIPNSTIPQVYTLAFPHYSFPVANVSLYDGFNALYPAGQAVSGTNSGIAAVELTTSDTAPGNYTLYLCVVQIQSDRLSAATAYAFTVDVGSS